MILFVAHTEPNDETKEQGRISESEKLQRMKGGHMRRGSSKAAVEPELIAQLKAAAAMPDSQIDTTDPDASEAMDWSEAVRGRFYRPVKTLKSLRLDADVLAYFQAQGKGYQTRINALLRASMLQDLQRAETSSRKAKKTG